VKHSILEVLQYYGVKNLRECHGWQKMKCPIHDDSHASAGVNIDDNIFTCHGCGVKGDTYKLIMVKEGIKYNEAINYAETITGKSRTEIQGFNPSSGRLPSQERANAGRRKYSPPRSRRTSST
jgi:DNA primase